MRLTEQIQCKRIPQLTRICHLAKNLYNEANFQYRQFCFQLDEYLTYFDLYHILKSKDSFKRLPAQTSQQILKLLIRNWKSYWKVKNEYRKNPQKFCGYPKPPKYKKKDGEAIAIFTNQNCRIKNGFLFFPRSLKIEPIKTRIKEFQQVRIVPRGYYYVIEIIYNQELIIKNFECTRAIGIDIGVKNLVAIGTNCGVRPILIPGRKIKAINQFYNKIRGKYRSKVPSNLHETKRMNLFTRKRNNQIHDFFHKTSRKIINFCISHKIGNIIIGYNEKWKQNISLGKINNQTFVSIPFIKLINQIQYKGQFNGINVVITEESYTSKCSALDLEPIQQHRHYIGKRINRGLFRSQNGIVINADVNAALNIIRKVFPIASWSEGIAAVVLQPQTIRIS